MEHSSKIKKIAAASKAIFESTVRTQSNWIIASEAASQLFEGGWRVETPLNEFARRVWAETDDVDTPE